MGAQALHQAHLQEAHQQYAGPSLQAQQPATLYALQNSADFDVIYEKNSTEEMENSVLSKSRLSRVSRISRLGAEVQLSHRARADS